jgi:hypothetical protein
MSKKRCKTDKDKKETRQKDFKFLCAKCGDGAQKSDHLCKPEKK